MEDRIKLLREIGFSEEYIEKLLDFDEGKHYNFEPYGPAFNAPQYIEVTDTSSMIIKKTTPPASPIITSK